MKSFSSVMYKKNRQKYFKKYTGPYYNPINFWNNTTTRQTLVLLLLLLHYKQKCPNVTEISNLTKKVISIRDEFWILVLDKTVVSNEDTS